MQFGDFIPDSVSALRCVAMLGSAKQSLGGKFDGNENKYVYQSSASTS